MIPGKQYTPDDILALVWSRRWFVGLAIVAGMMAAYGVARMLPAEFQSETTIMVVPQRVPETYVRSTVTTRIEDRLKSISQDILSRVRLERIVGEFQLYPELRAHRSMDDVILRMRKDIEVRLVGGDTFRVSYTSTSPETAQKVAQRLASLFINENLRDREVIADDTSLFLDSQLATARARLVDQEKKLEAYRREYAGELPTQLQANQQMLQSTQMQLQGLEDSLNRERDRRLALDRELTDLLSPPAGAVIASGPSASAYTDEHPDVISARQHVRELQARLAQEAHAAPAPVAAAPDPARQARARQLRTELDLADRQIAARQAEEDRLRATIVEIRGRIDATPTRESELTSLTRDYQTLSQLYTTLLAKREDSKIAANLERRQIGEQFKILDPARVPERPIRPDRPRIVALGGGLGFALALGVIALLEYRSSGLRSEEEVRACTGLPVIAVVPTMTPLGASGRPLRRRLGGATYRSALPAGPWTD